MALRNIDEAFGVSVTIAGRHGPISRRQSLGISLTVTACLMASSLCAERVTIPLDGRWSVEEGVAPESIPASFSHTVAVPGLTNQAQPTFADVDQYETHEYVFTMKRYGILPATEKCEGLGRTRQQRTWFWYAREFQASARKDHATLIVHKAQFGTAVWLNGQKVGEHMGCFTAGRFDVTKAMKWGGANRLVIRIGAHPGAMPDWAFWGSDGEKGPWTPGIYDRVELLLADNPEIDSVQVAPRIAASEILVQTRIKNHGPPCVVDLEQKVSTWKGAQPVGLAARQRVELKAGEEKMVLQTVKLRGATLWSPDDPFLHVLETSTGGDRCATRFGMREMIFDPVTRQAVLNGKPCYLRGSSITLHRFFGDRLCGGLPWDEAWVRKLLVDIPRRMHWNCFRMCIGPAPQQWLDIADEAGLLLQYEFPIWSDREPMRHKLWKESDIEQQVREFMRDNWNHASLVLWDASNETHWDFLSKRLVPAVRGFDLSGRAWENGYEPPAAPGDPYEVHPYKFINYVFGKPPYFQMTDLEKPIHAKTPDWYARHAAIINEYDWLWLHRDGTPTALTKKVFDSLLGANATPDQRREFLAYNLAGLTEYWRAQRQHAGVLYLAYLDGDLPNAFTCDNFRDVGRLELDPRFEHYVQHAFKPLGVYVDFWQPRLSAGTKRTYRVVLVNDTQETAKGRLQLTWTPEQGGPAAEQVETALDVPPAGQVAYQLELTAPSREGRYLLCATATCDGRPWGPTLSRRKVALTAGNTTRSKP